MKLRIKSIDIRRDTYGPKPDKFIGEVRLSTADLSVNQEIKLTSSTIESVLDIIEPLALDKIESEFGEQSKVNFEPSLRIGMKEAEGEVINL